MPTVIIAGMMDDKATRQAFEDFKRFEIPNRTTWMVYDNQTTYWNAKLVLMQAIDESYDGKDGYQRDTGVTVAGVNVTGPSAQRTPIQQGINVTGTRGKCSAQLVGRNGEEQTFTHPDVVAEQGKYFVTLYFGIKPRGSASDTASVIAIDDGGKKYTFEMPLSKRQ